MPEARLTTKGQVTIPKEIREALQLESGDRVLFYLREDGVVELRPQSVNLEDLYGLLEYEGKPLTVEEINSGIAKAVVDSFEKSVGE